MDELQLHDILMNNPSLLEDGLTFIKKEVRIGPYRCDLLFSDKNGNDLFVEVKLKADDRAVGQVLRYSGLIKDQKARFMLAAVVFVHGLREGLAKHGYESKEIPIEEFEHNLTDKHKGNQKQIKMRLTTAESKYQSPEDVIAALRTSIAKTRAKELFNYLNSWEDTYFYISDGIMFKRNGRSYKFLSITTIGDRVLIHVPINRRDELYEHFRKVINMNIATNGKDKNQINIYLEDITSLAELETLIKIAYDERE